MRMCDLEHTHMRTHACTHAHDGHVCAGEELVEEHEDAILEVMRRAQPTDAARSKSSKSS